MTEISASRRLLHLGILVAVPGVVALMARSWVPAAAAVPLLGLLLFAALEVALPLPVSARRRVTPSARMLLRDKAAVDVTLKPAPLPFNLNLDDGVPEGLRVVPGSAEACEPARGGAVARYRVEAERRGEHAYRSARVSRVGWLGVFRSTAVVPLPSVVTVMPASARERGVKVRARPPSGVGVTTNALRRGPGDEFYALREYQPGDAMGDVNWKASARMHRIITNEFLPEEPPRYLVYVDTRAVGAERGQPDVFERSMELASVLVEALVDARAQVGIVTLSLPGQFLVPGAGRAQLNRLRAVLQHAKPGEDAPIHDLVTAASAHLPARTEAILVTPNIYDRSLPDAVLALRARHGRVALVMPGYPRPTGKDLTAAAGRASAALLNAEQAATLAHLEVYASGATQWLPGEHVGLTLRRLGLTRRSR